MKTWKELIADAVEQKKGAAARLKAVKAAQGAILADVAVANTVADGARLRLYVDSWHCNLSAAVELTVADLKTDAALLAMLERALEHCTARKSHDNVNEWQAERVFSFDLPNGGSLRVEANIKADGVSCRKVVVGTTTKVIPTYELRCD